MASRTRVGSAPLSDNRTYALASVDCRLAHNSGCALRWMESIADVRFGTACSGACRSPSSPSVTNAPPICSWGGPVCRGAFPGEMLSGRLLGDDGISQRHFVAEVANGEQGRSKRML